AIDREPVRREAAEARPFVLERDDPPVDDLLQPVDGDCDVELLRRGVAGIAWRLVMRAQPEPSARLRLEIEAAERVDDQRQLGRRGRIDPKLGDGSPARPDAE